MKLELVVSPPTGDLKIISQGLQSHNGKFLIKDVVLEKDTKFAVFVRNDEGVIVGGIKALAFWNYCIIEQLWVSDEVRGSGVGSQLISMTERYAFEKGFRYIRTETVSFQAKPFYEKLGYKVYGELEDCPKGYTTYCLTKKL